MALGMPCRLHWKRHNMISASRVYSSRHGVIFASSIKVVAL
jgi:hypothetical protein